MKTLYLITGTNGSIGAAYAQELLRSGEYVIAVARSAHNPPWPAQKFVELMDAQACHEMVSSLNLEGITRIVFLHSVGKFACEEFRGPVLDDIWQSNFTTFVNVAEPLLNVGQKHGLQIVFVGIGSISDPFLVPTWNSFTRAKDEIRAWMRRTTMQFPEHRGLMINVSSVDTPAERRGRPFADTSYWMTPEYLVAKTVARLKDPRGAQFEEIAVFWKNPDYIPFSEHARIHVKWMQEVYGPDWKPKK